MEQPQALVVRQRFGSGPDEHTTGGAVSAPGA